ncbi:MAG: DUF2484 family protein [Roseicyclus sp.]
MIPVPLLLAGLWVLAAIGAKGASPRLYGRASWALIVTGIPLLGFVTLEIGPVAGLVGLALGVLLIRGPRPDAAGPAGGER